MPRTSGTRPKGSGIPAKGAGRGGPAKGAGKRVSLEEARAMRWHPDNLAAKAEAAARMKDVLHAIALTGENEHARISAAGALLDRIEGKPLQRQDVTSAGDKIAPLVVEIVRFGEDSASE